MNRTLPLLLALAAAAAPAAAQAPQTLDCGNTGGQRSVPALAAFTGSYSILRAEAEDGGNLSLITPFAGVRVPAAMGPSRIPWGRSRDYHGNQHGGIEDVNFGADMSYRAHNARATSEWIQGEIQENGFVDPTEAAGRAGATDKMEIPGWLRSARTSSFCVGASNGLAHFRGGFVFDVRYKKQNCGFLGANCWDAAADAFNEPDPEDWDRLAPWTNQEPVPGLGFPTLRYYVEPGREARAQQLADRLYENPTHEYAAAGSGVTTYEFDLYGHLRRETRREKRCDSLLGTGLFEDCEWVRYYVYKRSLVGLLRMRQHMDARVGTRANPTPESPVIQHDLRVIFEGDEIRADQETAVRRGSRRLTVGEVVQRLCGNAQGCGIAVEQVPIPGGTQYIEGADEEERREEMCRALARRTPGMDVTDCTLNDQNRVVESLNVSPEDARRDLNVKEDLDRPTAADTRAVRSGQRSGGVNGQSQLERTCRGLIAKEAEWIANGGTVGTASRLPPELAGMGSATVGPQVPPECDQFRPPPPDSAAGGGR